ncbi:MAG: hypothetical protein FWF57_00925 [Defluviitaleaceae bacterium]|nr:hypothetical protein [Defluviitaleaceae bacterium]
MDKFIYPDIIITDITDEKINILKSQGLSCYYCDEDELEVIYSSVLEVPIGSRILLSKTTIDKQISKINYNTGSKNLYTIIYSQEIIRNSVHKLGNSINLKILEFDSEMLKNIVGKYDTIIADLRGNSGGKFMIC